MKVERGYADVNGTSLYYEAAGSGPPLVLTHGGALDLRMWDDQFKLFARRYRVVRYDVRGYGKSALPTQEGYRRPDDLKTLMDYLEIESAYIVGLSMGGGISIEFALAYPSATDALVPIGSGLSGYQRSDEWLGLLERRKAVSDEASVQAARDFWLNTYVFSPALERPDVGARRRQDGFRLLGIRVDRPRPVRSPGSTGDGTAGRDQSSNPRIGQRT